MPDKMATSCKISLVDNKGMLINSLYGMYGDDARREYGQKKVTEIYRELLKGIVESIFRGSRCR